MASINATPAFNLHHVNVNVNSELGNTRPSLKAFKELCAASPLLFRERRSVLGPHQSHRRVVLVTRTLPFHSPSRHNHKRGRVYDEISTHSISTIEQSQSRHLQARYHQRRAIDVDSASITIAQSTPQHILPDHLSIITRSEPLQTVLSIIIYIDLMDAAFVKKEANWYKASLRYDNLSKLPPESLSQSNPNFKEALQDYYYESTDEGLKSRWIADDIQDPWPAPYKRVTPKKREYTPDSEELTAGIPPKDREEFNEELRNFRQENCPSDVEELPDPIVTKTTKAEKAKKAVISREKRAAAKARSIMPPHQHTRNTRLRAKAAQATTATGVQAPTGDTTETQDATATAAPPDADEDTVRSRQLSAPPFNSFMRDTRAAMNQNAFMSRPLRGVTPSSYFAAMSNAYNSVYPKARSVGDEPIGDDIPRTLANGQKPAGSKPDSTTTAAPQNTAALNKSAAAKPTARKTPAPKAATTKTAAPKTAAPKKSAPTKSAATKTVTSKAASINTVNSSVAKDNSATIKLPRAAKACDPCRAHKSRCSGGTPCEACVRRGFNCVYAPGGRKAPVKRVREDSQEVVKKEPLDKDPELEGRPAKRARKEKAIPTKEKAISIKKKAIPTKEKVTSTKKASANSSDGTAGASNAQPSKILPSIEEVPEDNEGPNAQPAKMQHLSHPKFGKNSTIQPTKTQSSYSGRITRSRSRQLSEEAEAHAAKLQYMGKRAREETEDPEERPAKLQRSNRKGPNYRKPDGNPQILRVIDSMRVDSEGNAQTDSPWIGYDYEATWMSNTYMEWEKSFDWPDLNLKSQDESFHARPSIKLVMTDVLKGILVDDWEHVTKDSQLVPLPHEQPVAKILNDYLEDEMPKREEDSAQVDILKETIAGLREYFDRALGRILLYRQVLYTLIDTPSHLTDTANSGSSFERLQYSELLPQWENEKDGGPSSVYGGEHLCRLLGRLPSCSAFCDMIVTDFFPSLTSGAACPNQHGSAIRQPPSRGADQVHQLAEQERPEILCPRVRGSRPRIPGESQELLAEAQADHWFRARGTTCSTGSEEGWRIAVCGASVQEASS